MSRARRNSAWVLGALSLFALAYARFSTPLLAYVSVRDLERIPQNAEQVLPPESRLTSSEAIRPLDFGGHFFAVWDAAHPPLSPRIPEALTPAAYADCYSEALQPRPRSWAEEEIAQAAYGSLNSLKRPAIVVHTTDLRGLPTTKPCFADPRRAGEGFPFDYLQLTSLYLGTPVRISHFSRDGQWAFVDTSVEDQGWVAASALAPVSPSEEKSLRSSALAVLTRDDLPFAPGLAQSAERTRIGMVLPGQRDGDGQLVLRWPEAREGSLRWRTWSAPDDAARDRPLRFTRPDLVFAVERFLGQPYGWGDSYGNRDCSGMIRDFYALFGRLMPPSSLRALHQGNNVSLVGMPPAEKRALLVEKGIPFRTLIGRKGHLAIYAGMWQGGPLLFHTLWGLKLGGLGVEGRALIGRAVLTGTTPGKELRNLASEGALLDGATDLTILDEAP